MTTQKDISSQLEDLSCLYEITKNLASSTDLKECLDETMKTIDSMKQMENGTVTIINPSTGKLEIEVAHGINAEGRKRGKYQIGEGITGKVVASGDPIIIPHIAEEPMFLNKTRARGDLSNQTRSFLCVPIRGGKQVIGALSVDRIYREGITEQADADLRFLTILSSLIARTTQRIQAVNQEQDELRVENLKLKRELSEKNKINDIQGNSSRMQEVYEMIHRVVDSNATVLLRGESGTGKTLVAKALHYNSKRKEKPFIVVNCSALPETLLESELFGHEKGAFTGAVSRKKGRFEIAEGGTLFLDEITEMSLSMQVKFLRILQEQEVMPVGGTTPVKVNVRFVAATNRDLEKEVKAGNFRQDLFYRINVVSLKIPPLSERKDDIPLLVQFFLDKYNASMNKEIAGVSQEVLDTLQHYDFPGNVRELENIIERGVALANSNTIGLAQIPDDLRSLDIQTFRKRAGKYASMEEVEKSYIEWILKETGFNKTAAAKALDIDRVSLWRKIKKLGLE